MKRGVLCFVITFLMTTSVFANLPPIQGQTGVQVGKAIQCMQNSGGTQTGVNTVLISQVIKGSGGPCCKPQIGIQVGKAIQFMKNECGGTQIGFNGVLLNQNLTKGSCCKPQLGVQVGIARQFMKNSGGSQFGENFVVGYQEIN